MLPMRETTVSCARTRWCVQQFMADQRDLLHTLLANNHFDYFELDEVVQLDVLPL